ncbi:spermidine/putrescine ABC transporter permease [Escherichia coli Nissle 1917]|nr:spermidine/putrescine ABC transporter permease [Escherichia coli Nissle 1917]
MKNTSKFQNVVIVTIVGWLVLFVFLPNLMIIGTSFLTRDDASFVKMVFTLDNYTRLLDPLYFEVLLHSLNMALIATLASLVLGYPFAWFLAKLPHKVRPLLLFLLIVPFWTNSLIRIYGLKIFLSTKGYLNEFLLWLGVIDTPIRIMFTPSAVIIGLVYILLPFMVMPLYSSIEKLDKPLLEAARDLGASKLQTFIRIIIPLTMPGIIAGCLLVMLPAMGLFYVSDLMGGAKNLLIGNVIKVQFLNIRDWPFGAATSITLTIVMGLMLLVYWRASRLLNKKVLKLYDWWVLGVSNRLAWGCPTKEHLLPHFLEHLGNNHLDIGVGTGFYLTHVPESSLISLMDLNEASLNAASTRAGESKIKHKISHDVFDPYPAALHGQFDSISMFYLLHCLRLIFMRQQGFLLCRQLATLRRLLQYRELTLRLPQIPALLADFLIRSGMLRHLHAGLFRLFQRRFIILFRRRHQRVVIRLQDFPVFQCLVLSVPVLARKSRCCLWRYEPDHYRQKYVLPHAVQ